MASKSESRRADSTGATPRRAPVSGDWPPRVWLLTGHKAGDNAQLRALAEALDWPFETKRLSYRPTELISAEQLEHIHEASLTILEEIGIEVLLPEARELLREAGATVAAAGEWTVPGYLGGPRSLDNIPACRGLLGQRFARATRSFQFRYRNRLLSGWARLDR